MKLRLAIVTRARAPYHKALQEALAAELGASGGELRLFYPHGSSCVFAQSASLPQAAHLSVVWVNATEVSAKTKGYGTNWKSEAIPTQLPSHALWRELDAYAPAIVWVHEYSPYTLGALLWAKWRGKPVVVSSEIGRANQHYFPSHIRLWHRFWAHLADGIIACTPAALQPLCNDARPIVAAFHAADSRHLCPLTSQSPQRRLTIVQTGSILPRKGADLLLQALLMLKQSGVSDWVLRLAGHDAEGWGQSWINRYQLQSQVQITGHLDGEALWSAFGNADVFTLATRQDTYAAVVHEAACLGLPLIISRHAGAAQALVEDGINGWIIDPENPHEYAAKLFTLFDSELRLRMSRASRQTAEHFSAHVRAPAVLRWMQYNFPLQLS